MARFEFLDIEKESRILSPSFFQQAIFDALQETRDNLIISAVAGSGKTTTLLEIARRSDAKRKLFLAFNKKIVSDMIEKAEDLGIYDLEIKTVHAFGYRALAQEYGGKLDVQNWKYSDIAAAEIREKTGKVRLSKDDLALSGLAVKLLEQKRLRMWKKRSDVLDYALEIGAEIKDAREAIDLMANCEIMGQAAFFESGLVSFSDMLYLPFIHDLPSPKFDLVLLDECQDFSPLQRAIIGRYAEGARVVAAGDPRQAIYAFAAADCDSYYKVKQQFGMVEYPLSVCYRCPQIVVDQAKEIVPQIQSFSENAGGVYAEISWEDAVQMAEPGDLFICRKNSPVISFFFHLAAEKKPAMLIGKDVGQTLSGLVEKIDKKRHVEFQEAIKDYFMKRIQEAGDPEKDDRAARAIERLREQKWCLLFLWSNIRHEGSVLAFQHEIEDLFREDRPVSQVITLCSIHKAKGAEADRVFIINRHEMPWKQKDVEAQEQENNLLYVALTRAKKELFYFRYEV